MYEQLGAFPHNLATSSPLIVNDLVYVVTSTGVEKDHITVPNPRAPSFIAVNKHTGELVWEDRGPGEKVLHGQWSSPCYIRAGGRDQIVFPGGDGLVWSLDALTGKLVWTFDCNPKDSVWELGGRGTRNNIISTPVSYDGKIFIGVGQDPEHGEGPGHLYAIDASKEGDITETGKIWHLGDDDFNRTMSTAAIHDGLMYISDLSGFLYCLDAKTGKKYWTYDMFAAIWGSATVIDDKVYLGDEDGDMAVFETGKTLKKLSEINMENSVYSTPVAANGVLYISNRKRLFAIAEEK
jgi:outer membrane protein assembly factor BamB